MKASRNIPMTIKTVSWPLFFILTQWFYVWIQHEISSYCSALTFFESTDDMYSLIHVAITMNTIPVKTLSTGPGRSLKRNDAIVIASAVRATTSMLGHNLRISSDPCVKVLSNELNTFSEIMNL